MISAQFLGHRSRGAAAFLFFASELKNLHHLSFSISVVGVFVKGASQHDTHRDLIYASTVYMYIYIYIDEWHDESLSFGIKKSQDLLVNIAQHIAQHIPQLNDIGRKKKFALGSQLTNLIFTSEI